jgi:hypothetical protein
MYLLYSGTVYVIVILFSLYSKLPSSAIERFAGLSLSLFVVIPAIEIF